MWPIWISQARSDPWARNDSWAKRPFQSPLAIDPPPSLLGHLPCASATVATHPHPNMLQHSLPWLMPVTRWHVLIPVIIISLFWRHSSKASSSQGPSWTFSPQQKELLPFLADLEPLYIHLNVSATLCLPAAPHLPLPETWRGGTILCFSLESQIPNMGNKQKWSGSWTEINLS